MSELNHKDSLCLFNMLDSIEKIFRYSEKFNSADELYGDSIAFDAVLMNFIVIGEMAGKLSDKLISESQNKIDWLKIKGFRNIIAHNYFGVDAEEVWQIIHSSLKDLHEEIRNLLNIK